MNDIITLDFRKQKFFGSRKLACGRTMQNGILQMTRRNTLRIVTQKTLVFSGHQIKKDLL